MIDYQNLPDNAKIDWFMQPTATNEVHTWTKPVGCNFVYMIAVGGGGAGGNGGSGAAGTARGGGGGGASAAINTLLVPAFLIPDTLFIKVGRGGSRLTLTLGTPTIISAYRISSNTEYFLNASQGGQGGNGAAGGTGGAGAAANSILTNSTLATIGKWQGVTATSGGSPGIISGASGNDNVLNFFNNGGGGGGSTTSGNFSGGNIISTYNQTASRTVIQGGAAVAGATAGQNDGGSGFFIPKRFASFGGAGGGASNTGVGGNGGNGGPGCGGGGAGAGVTGGIGGSGGDGFAVIISY